MLLPELRGILKSFKLVNVADAECGPRILPMKPMAHVVISFDPANGGRPSHEEATDARKLSDAESEAKRVRVEATELAKTQSLGPKCCSSCGKAGHNRRTCPPQSLLSL